MHNQASARGWLVGVRSAVRLAPVVGLYGVTVGVELMIAAPVRWIVVYLGAAITGTVIPLGLSAEVFAWFAALVPVVWSLFALVCPGRGRVWRWRSGARPVTLRESEVLRDALRGFGERELRRASKLGFHVLDVSWPWAGVVGDAIMLSRVLVDSDALPAVLAHELGHVDSGDGRLTAAVARLRLWGDPLGSDEFELTVRGYGGSSLDDGVLFWLVRLVVRVCGGGVGVGVCGWLWAAYWRRREFAADAYAVSLGQGDALVRFLEEYELVLDEPQRGVLVKRSEYPPVACRIDRLRVLLDCG